MTPTAAHDEQAVLDLARKLSPDARERIANELLDGLEPVGPTPYATEAIRLAWKEEIARRIAAYEQGELETMTVEEVIAQLEADQRDDERRAG